jgi:hypothetical protein
MRDGDPKDVPKTTFRTKSRLASFYETCVGNKSEVLWPLVTSPRELDRYYTSITNGAHPT